MEKLMDKDIIYKKILDEAQADANIIGFLLAGGRGKGFVTEHSDYDVIVIVEDKDNDEYINKYKDYKDTSEVHVKVFSITDFSNYAEWQSDSVWDRYNFTHLAALIDRNEEIQKLVDQKGALPEAHVKEVVSANLDAYINSYHRSIKNFRDQNLVASHLDASESVTYLLTVLFALEGRIRPYNKYLEWELSNYPLEKLPWDKATLVRLIKQIVVTGNTEIQKQVFDIIIKTLAQEGFGDVVESWRGYFLGKDSNEG